MPPLSVRFCSKWTTNQIAGYNIQTDANIPVVNVGTPNDPKYLPAEVCQVIPGQPSKAKLTPEQTRGMINFAVRKPAENAKSIVTKGASVLGVTPRMNETLVSKHAYVYRDFVADSP